jgi:hypothetical protein
MGWPLAALPVMVAHEGPSHPISSPSELISESMTDREPNLIARYGDNRVLGNRATGDPWAVGLAWRGSFFSAALAILSVSTPVFADVVQIRGGGQVEGKVSRVDSPKVPYAVVQLDDSVKVAIPESQVNRVAEAANLAEYRARAAAIRGDAEQHYELARWCKQQQLNAQYRYHLQWTVRIDPDHSKARTALGYANHEGKWVRVSDLQKSRGLISVGGKYRLPAELMITQAQKEAETKSKIWVGEIARLKKLIARGGDRAAEAMAALAAIDDPFASAAIGKELTESVSQPRDLRLFWIQKLTQFRTPAALEALARVGLSDPDSVVREKALETLRELAPGLAIANYLPLLRSNDNAVVRRAAEALSYFPEPELMLPLIDALVTEHKTFKPADQSTNVGFNNAGGGGMSTGGKAQTIVHPIENPPVLAVLQQIEPEVNFGFDQVRWRQYLASKLSGYQGDMRRDD